MRVFLLGRIYRVLRTPQRQDDHPIVHHPGHSGRQWNPCFQSAMTQHPNRFNKYLFTRVIGSPTRIVGSLFSRSKCHTTLFRGSPWAEIMQRALMCCQPTRGALNTNTAGNNNKKAVGRDDAGGDACTSLNRLAPHTPQNLRVPLKFRLVPTSRDSSRCLLICAHT